MYVQVMYFTLVHISYLQKQVVFLGVEWLVHILSTTRVASGVFRWGAHTHTLHLSTDTLPLTWCTPLINPFHLLRLFFVSQVPKRKPGKFPWNRLRPRPLLRADHAADKPAQPQREAARPDVDHAVRQVTARRRRRPRHRRNLPQSLLQTHQAGQIRTGAGLERRADAALLVPHPLGAVRED